MKQRSKVNVSESSVKTLLKDFFHSCAHQYNRLTELIDELQEAGHFGNMNWIDAATLTHRCLCDHPNDFYFIQKTGSEGKFHNLWGLTSWQLQPQHLRLKAAKREGRMPGPLVLGTTMSFTLIDDAIEKGFFKLQHGRTKQITDIIGNDPIPILCYGAYQIMCWAEPLYSVIYGEGLKQWYQENRVEPEDTVALEVFSSPPDDPLVLRIYTKWEKSPDRRHEPIYHREISKRGEHTILVLIWSLLKDSGTTLHINDIVSYVHEIRPEVKRTSIESCLSNNKSHFCSFGKSLWGLAEWNLNEIDIEKILGTIYEEDMVYDILSHASEPLTVHEIANRIGKALFVEPQLILRTNFIDFNDPRFVKVSDNKWWLERNKQTIVETLQTQIQAKEGVIDHLNSEMAEQTTKLNQLKNHLDEAYAEKDKLHEKAQAIEAINAELEQKLIDANTALKDTKQRVEKLLAEIKRLRKQIKKTRLRTIDLEAQISNLTVTTLFRQKLAIILSRLKRIIGR